VHELWKNLPIPNSEQEEDTTEFVDRPSDATQDLFTQLVVREQQVSARLAPKNGKPGIIRLVIRHTIKHHQIVVPVVRYRKPSQSFK